MCCGLNCDIWGSFRRVVDNKMKRWVDLCNHKMMKILWSFPYYTLSINFIKFLPRSVLIKPLSHSGCMAQVLLYCLVEWDICVSHSVLEETLCCVGKCHLWHCLGYLPWFKTPVFPIIDSSLHLLWRPGWKPWWSLVTSGLHPCGEQFAAGPASFDQQCCHGSISSDSGRNISLVSSGKQPPQ